MAKAKKKSVLHKHVPTKMGYSILAAVVLVMGLAMSVAYNQYETTLKSEACTMCSTCAGNYQCHYVCVKWSPRMYNGRVYCEEYKDVPY